jgi:hypothetical protein
VLRFPAPRPDVTIALVGLVFFLSSTSGLPPELWDPLVPERAAATGSSGGLSIAIVLALLAFVLLAGFLIGERVPLRRRG